jgi:hypothetical protein
LYLLIMQCFIHAIVFFCCKSLSKKGRKHQMMMMITQTD